MNPQLFQSLLGSSSLDGLLNNNLVFPVGALLALSFVRSLLRTGRGLLPLAALVLLMLGKDAGVSEILGGRGASSGSLGFNPAALLERDGMLLPAVVLALALFLARGYLFSAVSLLPLAAIGILLMQKDYRISAISSDPVRGPVLIVGAVILILYFAFRFFRRRSYPMGYFPAVPFSVRLAQQMNALKPFFHYAAGGLAGLLALTMLINPDVIEQHVPGWRLTLGLGFLLIALFGFARSLPERIRTYLVPAYWGAVVILLAVSLWRDPAVSGAVTAGSDANASQAEVESF